MRSRRFGRTKKEKKEALDVDITSLLDILVILLVFLLKSYNASDLKLEVAKNVEIPKSESVKLGNMSIIVQVGSDKSLWINNEKIGTVSLNSKEEKIEELFSRLEKEAKSLDSTIKELEASRNPANKEMEQALKTRKKNRKKVNIVMDQSLPYEVLRRVMHTSAMAGFPEFKFIVQGNF